MKQNTFLKLLQFLNRLEQTHISYSLAHHRDEAIMVIVAVPGERWEIEFLDDGSIEVERFISDGEIKTEDVLNELFTIHANQGPEGEVVSQEAELIPAVR